MTYPKEPGFFVEELGWKNGWGWYEGLFQGAGDSKALGEASTHYTKLPIYQGVAERIAQHLPDVKLIYLMRDPVARAISHYWHCVHYDHETRSINRALRPGSDYLNFGMYAMQLSSYLAHFPIEQFLFLTHEELKANCQNVVGRCYQFLGVDESFQPKDELNKAHNVGPSEVRYTRKLLHNIRWSRWWTRVSPVVPQRFKEIAKRLEFTRVARERHVSANLIASLRDMYSDANEDLFAITGERWWDLTSASKQDAAMLRATK